VVSPEEFVPNEQLRRARSLKGWTQAEMAEQVGTSFEIVSRWERGVTIPSAYFRKRLCVALGKTAEELGLLGRPMKPSTLSPSPLVVLASSYTDEAKAIVMHLKTALHDRGITTLSGRQISKWGGASPHDALRGSIRTAKVILLIISPEARTSRHVREALELARMYQRPLCGVWIEGKSWQACLPKGSGELSAPIDARGRDGPGFFEEVIRELEQRGLAPGPSTLSTAVQPKIPTSTLPPRNPYKGLQAFRGEDRQDFFGRKALIDELTVALERSFSEEQHSLQYARLLHIVGSSGSGKSSVVLAGLLPHLQAGGLPGSGAWVYLDPIMPGMHPLESLALSLSAQLPDRSLHSLRQDLQNDSARGLHLLATALIKRRETKVVLFVDQVEEVFSQAPAEQEHQQFVDLLVTAMTEPHGPVIVILTLRADFIDRLMRYPELYRLLEAHQKAVLPMTITDLRAIIEQPAAQPDVQLVFEGDLVGDLLFEAQGEPGALPLLEFSLAQLFERRSDHTLTLQTYQEMGGMRGALAQHAEETYTSLPSDEHRRLARTLFLRLIEPGVTEQDTTRRRAPLCELQLTDAKETIMLEEVTQTFTSARLLTTNTVADVATVEVSHEAVIREWTRLANWLREAREDIHLQQTISEDAAAWERHGKPGDRLYRGSQLKSASVWATRSTASRSEIAFLRASTLHRVRFLISVLVVCLLLLSLATVAIQLGLNQPPDPTRVTNLQDDGLGSLRWAIGNAPAGSTIAFDERLWGKTIKLTSGDLQITRNLRIQGPVTESLTISSDSVIGTKSIKVSNNAVVTISNIVFKGTALRSSGGDSPGIINSATLTLINSTVSDYFTTSYYPNSIQGGGITNSGKLTLINDTIANNESLGGTGGGGILNTRSGILTLANSTISGNETAPNGGGILTCGILTVTASTIVGNKAEDGGGIYNCGALTVTNSTVSDNSSDGNGAGIAIEGTTAQATLTSSTIYGNRAGNQGGGIFNSADNKQLVMSNSLVAANTAFVGPDIAGSLTSHGYNLIQDTVGAIFSPNKQTTTDVAVAAHTDLGIDPQLSGRLPQIHALHPGSLAIDAIPLAACSVTTDQRGAKRPDGYEDRCDIGAYEYTV
jgi:transcriptional regulator with XRE-family HTH domain